MHVTAEQDSQGFVADGHERAREAIRQEVLAEYAERLARGNFWQRIRLRREIDREVERRVRREAPPEALY